MHKVIFYPVGRGDSSQIVLANGRRILMDFRHLEKGTDASTPEIDLAKRLREELATAKRDYFDVVAFTHGDDDHTQGATDFFELWHADKYMGNGRIKMNELWLPAAMVIEPGTNGQQLTDRVLLRQEARHRLKLGKGIRVYSKPELLKDWMAENDIDFESRKHLFVDAGTLAPGFNIAADGVEFFVHSPFVEHTDEGDDLRNGASLIFNVRFDVDGAVTDYLAVGDTAYDVLEQIVKVTEWHGRMDRLRWDLFNVPHHCSYKALGPEKGKEETTPVAGVEKLLLQGQVGAYLVSSSNPIFNSRDAYEQDQPPHIQARNTYEKYIKAVKGAKFLVTMEEPNAAYPEPLVFEISGNGCAWLKSTKSGAAVATAVIPPRAG